MRAASQGELKMWTEAHRARHDGRLKDIVSNVAVGELPKWITALDPPLPDGRLRTPARRVVAAIAWHLRVGSAWRRLPRGFPPWRTVYGLFRSWLDLGIWETLVLWTGRQSVGPAAARRDRRSASSTRSR